MTGLSVKRALAALASLAVLALMYPPPASAQSNTAGDLAIIAHSGVPVDGLTLPELRQVFKAERQYWTKDLPIVVFVRAASSAERTAVLKVIFQMAEQQFQNYWTAKTFRAEAGTSPKNLTSNELTQRFVAAKAGAIGFMAASDVKPGVKVLRIDGHLPLDRGYPLHLSRP
jgi:ABC-type phosphate transport system substrate-binding protein